MTSDAPRVSARRASRRVVGGSGTRRTGTSGTRNSSAGSAATAPAASGADDRSCDSRGIAHGRDARRRGDPIGFRSPRRGHETRSGAGGAGTSPAAATRPGSRSGDVGTAPFPGPAARGRGQVPGPAGRPWCARPPCSRRRPGTDGRRARNAAGAQHQRAGRLVVPAALRGRLVPRPRHHHDPLADQADEGADARRRAAARGWPGAPPGRPVRFETVRMPVTALPTVAPVTRLGDPLPDADEQHEQGRHEQDRPHRRRRSSSTARPSRRRRRTRGRTRRGGRRRRSRTPARGCRWTRRRRGSRGTARWAPGPTPVAGRRRAPAGGGPGGGGGARPRGGAGRVAAAARTAGVGTLYGDGTTGCAASTRAPHSAQNTAPGSSTAPHVRQVDSCGAVLTADLRDASPVRARADMVPRADPREQGRSPERRTSVRTRGPPGRRRRRSARP